MSLETIYEIEIPDIKIGGGNVRKSHPTKELEQLAASIKKHGLLQPVLLLGEFGKPPYKLISGQRRFLAHEMILRKKKIRAVFAGNLDQKQQVIRSLVENTQRVNLEYIDTARAITYLYEHFDKDERKLQQATGLSIRKIRDYILIEAQATPRIKKLLREKKVSPADVKRALRAAQANISKAEELLDLMIKLNPNAHQKKRIVRYGEKDKTLSANKIVKEAMKPHVEDNIIISVPKEIMAALRLAIVELSMDPEEIASKAISDWLRSQGFLK